MTGTELTTVTLTAAERRKAERTIENVHLAFYQKGGIRDTIDRLNKQRTSTAQEIFALARFATEQSKGRDAAIAKFKELCLHAESHYKAQHDVENLKDVLPTWAPLKSGILRGVREYQLSPTQYRSEGAFRIAMQKKQQQTMAPRIEGEPGTPITGRVATAEQVDHMLSTTVRLNSLRTLLAQIVFECEVIKKKHVLQAELVLRNTMNSLQPFVDQRKVQ
jgi:hypothetical protein